MEMKCKLIILSPDGRKFGCELCGGESFIWEQSQYQFCIEM